MASLSKLKIGLKPQLFHQALPKALSEVIHFIFSSVQKELWLVGGTALAGYYAAHRRSDDLDLFAGSQETYRLAIQTVKTLTDKGAVLFQESTSSFYYHAQVNYLNHAFTLDIVLDPHLHKTGHALQADDGAWVADLSTLLAMKVAALVSRCSEKDLFDLDWLLDSIENQEIGDLIALGASMDAGVHVETLLISLKGAILREEACHFLLPDASLNIPQAYRRIENLRKKLIEKLLTYEKTLSPSPEAKALSQALKDLKKLK